jgi:hypothetical protein
VAHALGHTLEDAVANRAAVQQPIVFHKDVRTHGFTFMRLNESYPFYRP